MGESQYTLSDAINKAIHKALLDVFTALPGEVVSYNPDENTVDVVPSIQKLMTTGKSDDLPKISSVPIIWPRSSVSSFSFPLAAGDQVLLVFLQRNPDQWKRLGKGYPPKDARLFPISGAVAIPGLFPITKPLKPAPKGTDVRGEAVNLSKSGDPKSAAVLGDKLQKNLEDLIKAVDDLITAITQTATVASGPIQVFTAGGPASQQGFGYVLPTATTAVTQALAAVKSALPDENSQIVKLE